MLFSYKSITERAMQHEEDETRIAKQMLNPLPLDRLGIDELQQYIRALESEIARVTIEIAKKSNHRSAADQFFKAP